MGPIGEGGSLLLRINRNCPWNRCIFCPAYKGRMFSPRSVDEVCRDIDAASRTRAALRSTIARFREIPAHDRARMLLDRTLKGRYLDYLDACGCRDEKIETALTEALRSIDRESPDAIDKVDRALRLIKSKGIP